MGNDWESILGKYFEKKEKEKKEETPSEEPKPEPTLAPTPPSENPTQPTQTTQSKIQDTWPPTVPVQKQNHDDEASHHFWQKEEKVSPPPSPPSPPSPQPAPSLPTEGILPIDEGGMEKVVITIYGRKGEGKTTLAMSAPGTKAVLSFDRKSGVVKRFFYNNDPSITVFDVGGVLDFSSPEAELQSSERAFNLIINTLKSIRGKYDWIIIDGAEIAQLVCEMTMRYRNGLKPFEGIANRNLWKERRMYIRQLHKEAFTSANRGIIYTTFIDKDEVVVDGELITKEDIPKWVDVLMYETDTVIRVKAEVGEFGKKFIAEVKTSKLPFWDMGVMDITNAPQKLWEKYEKEVRK